jgi:primosomal protein N' (replication factor Y) (superfamily II helicase)
VPESLNIIQVALPVPLYRRFDYLASQPLPPVGCRILVPFGRQQLVGIVTAHPQESELALSKLKPIARQLDESALFPTSLWMLLLWAADYYHHPIGEVLHHALPVLLRQGEIAERKPIPCWQLRLGSEDTIPSLKRAPRQQQALRLLLDGPLPAAELREQGIDTPVLTQLADKNLIEPFDLHLQAREWLDHLLLHEDDAPYLNREQAIVLAAISQSDSKRPFLLEGVTGSGKTEVYLQLIRGVLAQGKQVLVLVPEIGLTPQLLRRFRRRFHAPILTLHSGMNDRERLDTWLACRAGEAAILIGTRSAIFTPFKELGLIIVDEEHDSSFKQQEGFRYHGRDLAIVRAQREQIPIVLGSATPSLESFHNALQGRYHHLQMTQRAGGAQAAKQHLLDVKNLPLQAGIAPQLLQLMDEQLTAGNQVMLFLNRRGYAPALLCHDCGWVAACPHCDAFYTWHQQDKKLHCHHCDHIRPVPHQCPDCQSSNIVSSGVGTEQLAQFLMQRFPAYKTIRIDRDNTRRKGELEAHLDAIRRQEYQILLGTQMLAKGHHFPDVTLVGILDVDGALFAADFRATERLAQLCVQVAGRAGRAAKPGMVVLQSHHPEHALLQDLLNNGYHHFARTCLQERQALSLPPFSYQAVLRADSPNREPLELFMQQAAHICQHYGAPDLHMLGPVSPVMERRAGRYRMLLMLQCPQRMRLQHYLQHLLPAIDKLNQHHSLRWHLDVDPLEIAG